MRRSANKVIAFGLLVAGIGLVIAMRALFAPGEAKPASGPGSATFDRDPATEPAPPSEGESPQTDLAPLRNASTSFVAEPVIETTEFIKGIESLSIAEQDEARHLAQQYVLSLDDGRIIRWQPVLVDIDAVFNAIASDATDTPGLTPVSELSIALFPDIELRFTSTAFYQFEAGASWVGKLVNARGEMTIYLTDDDNGSTVALATLATDFGVFNISYLGQVSTAGTPVYFASEANRNFRELSH